MIDTKNDYKVGSFPIPNREDGKITREMKQSKEYCLQMAQGIYSEYVKGATYWTPADMDRISINRSYAEGRQDATRYMDNILGKATSDGVVSDAAHQRRTAYANLNFKIMSPMPRIMDKLVGYISEATDIVSVDTLDAYSSGLKENLKWGLYVDGKHKDMFETLRAMAGLPQEEVGFIPENVEELNLYDAEGGFMPAYASVMERLLKHTFEFSSWEENTIDRVISDLIVNGFAIVEDEFDPVTCKARISYRDPEYAGVQYTREDAYEKPDYGFCIVFTKVSDLKRRGVLATEKDAAAFANTIAGRYGNPATDNWNADNTRSKYSYATGYDSYVAPEFRCYWIDVEDFQEVKHTNRFGTSKTYPKKDKTKTGRMDEIISTRRKMLYGCRWIIDTDLVYEYGYVPHQNRDGLACPVIPLHAVKVTNTPLVDRVIPALDQYMLGWLKLQQGLSMAALNGYSIEIGSLSNISMGNKKMDPLELIKMWRQTGILFRKDKNVMGKIASTSRPIEEMKGGAGEAIAEARMLMDNAVNIIEQMTGINPISMGAQPSPEMGKAVAEFAIAGTDSVLKNVVKKVNILKSNVARSCCLRLQYIMRDESKAKKGYGDLIGDTELELVRMADGQDVKYGIRTHVRPTRDEIASLYQTIDLSLKNGRDGKVGITEADAVRLRAMISSGSSLKRVAQLLAFAHKRAEDAAQKRAIEMQKINVQVADQTAQIELQKSAMLTDMDIKKIQAQESAKLSANLLLEAYKLRDKTFEEITAMLSGQQPGQQAPPPPEQNPATQEAPTAPMGTQDNPTNIPEGQQGI